MFTSITTPLVALITAISLVPLSACVPDEVPESFFSSSVEETVPPSATETAEYGVPLAAHEAVGDEWFEDAAFIGHSLILGLSEYSGLETTDYYSLSGSSARTIVRSSEVSHPDGGKGTLESGLAKHSYEKIYLMLGINEVCNDLEWLKVDYLNFLALVRKYNPNADIFVLAVAPVTRTKDAGGTFTIANILKYNDMLQELCKEENCWYIDTYTAFADGEGFLPSSSSPDGIHLTVSAYKEMLEYVRTHTLTELSTN